MTQVALHRETPAQSFRKHAAVVHSSGELGLLERKLVNVLLLHAADNLLTHEEHVIPVSALCEIVGFKSNDTAMLKKALREICSHVIEFNLLGERGQEDWSASALLSRARIKDGKCSYAYDKLLAQRLYDPKVYASMNISMQAQFASRFTLALYENCLRFRAEGATIWLDLPVFRKLMGATTSAYDEFKRLSQRVIQPAVEEINLRSDIMVTAVLRREGRGGRVSGIRFEIQANPQKPLFQSEAVDQAALARQSPGYRRLLDLGVADRLAVAAVLYKDDFADRVAEITVHRANLGKVRTPAAYASSLINARETIDLPALTADAVAPPPVVENPQSLNIQFLEARCQRAEASLDGARRLELAGLFVAENPGYSGLVDLQRGNAMGNAREELRRFVATKVLGPATPGDFDAWRRARESRD